MSDTPVEITDASAFEHGSLGKQVLLAIVTFGLYGIYWWYQTQSQFAAGTSADIDPTMRTVLYVIPLVNLVAIWQFSQDAEAVVDESGVLLFVLFIVFPPAFWYLVQTGINEIAE